MISYFSRSEIALSGDCNDRENDQISIKTKVLHVMPTKTNVFGLFYNWTETENRNTIHKHSAPYKMTIHLHINQFHSGIPRQSWDFFLVKDVIYKQHTIKMWNKPHLVKVKEKIFIIFTSVVVFVLLSSIRLLRQSVRCEDRFQCCHIFCKTQLQKTIYCMSASSQ